MIFLTKHRVVGVTVAVVAGLLALGTLTATPASASVCCWGGTIHGYQSGRCLEAANWGMTDVAIWDCHGGANQYWGYGSADGSNELVMYPGTDHERCLDAENWGTTNGTRVGLWNCTGGANQKWIWKSDDTLVNVHSGKCLDANGAGNGARLQLWDCWGGQNQKWSGWYSR